MTAVALSTDLLLDGEEVVISARTHVKVLFLRMALGLVILAVAIPLILLVDDFAGGWVRWGLIAVTAVLLIWAVGVEAVQRYFWTYNLTTLRLIEQKGVFNRTGRIIPLSRINDVSFEKSLIDRMFGCGTLIIHDGSEQSGLPLIDIPDVERFHREISTLVLQAHGQELPDAVERSE